MDKAQAILVNGLAKLGRTEDSKPYMAYLELLQTWNARFNLTAIRNIEEMVTHHVLDSLAAAPWLYGERIIDIGTGAGFPGVILALAYPERAFTVIDGVGKKIRFIEHAVRTMKIPNVEAYALRAEDYRPDKTFDTVISRALTDINRFVALSKHLLSGHGVWHAMKGRVPEAELDSLVLPYQIHQYRVPFLDEQRCSIIIENCSKDT